MLKYIAMAFALKTLSLTPMTRRIYEEAINTLGKTQRVHNGLPQHYGERMIEFREQCREYGVIRNGHAVLELGTGWVHWESIIARLFLDVNITAFDVRDNRQLEAIRIYCGQLDRLIDQHVLLTSAESARAHSLLGAISTVSSFEELYQPLGLTYIHDPSGRLGRFHNDSYDAVISCKVLQHVRMKIVDPYVRDICRILKPGGYSIHTIDLSDHLAWRDSHVSLKNYLRYSDRTWKLIFENDLQCINRIQRSEWLELFASTGLELVKETSLLEDIGPITPHPKYRHLDRNDIACTKLTFIHRKPLNVRPMSVKVRAADSISVPAPTICHFEA